MTGKIFQFLGGLHVFFFFKEKKNQFFGSLNLTGHATVSLFPAPKGEKREPQLNEDVP